MSNPVRYWRAAEPVRLYLYGVLVPAVAVAAAYGLLDGSDVALWLALGAAVLGVPATEAARGAVTPVGRHRAEQPEH